MPNWIKNFEQLAITKERKDALEIIEAGLSAISTKKAVHDNVRIDGDKLIISGNEIDLNRYKSIKVIGFGKVACEAAGALEEVLGDKIKAGAVIDINKGTCSIIQMYSGTHPRPSSQNVEATKHIVELSRGISAEDLVLVIISGGGSSLLCYPESECADNDRLYQDFLSTGAPIQELNLVRKHLSLLKGGGLAKMFYPAKIVGLIFCDVPGGHSNLVASGPTFKDVSTAEEADAILTKYNIRDHYNLTETPKEDIFFENVLNITLASNELALNAMKKQAETLGYSAKIISSEIYDDMDATLDKLQQETSVDVVLAGGEPSLIIKTSGGSGGRNQYLTLKALRTIKQNELMIGIASDGIDNGPMAGAIADSAAKEATTAAGLDIDEHIYRYDAQTFFEKIGSNIFTGQTGSNVSDLMLILRKKNG